MRTAQGLIARIFSRKRWRLVQRIAGVHRIHHVRWSFGWTFPLTSWAYFEAFEYRHHLDRNTIQTRVAHWERLEHDREHHDCTASGRY